MYMKDRTQTHLTHSNFAFTLEMLNPENTLPLQSVDLDQLASSADLDLYCVIKYMNWYQQPG